MTKQLVVTGLEHMRDRKTLKVSLSSLAESGYNDMMFWYLPLDESAHLRLGDVWSVDCCPIPAKVAEIVEAIR